MCSIDFNFIFIRISFSSQSIIYVRIEPILVDIRGPVENSYTYMVTWMILVGLFRVVRLRTVDHERDRAKATTRTHFNEATKGHTFSSSNDSFRQTETQKPKDIICGQPFHGFRGSHPRLSPSSTHLAHLSGVHMGII